MTYKKFKKTYGNIIDTVTTFVAFSVIAGLVWCLTPNTAAFLIALITIAVGTVFYIAVSYILCKIWKRIKDKLKNSERSENKKMTNGDRIRSMTDEDLAVFLLTEECKVCTHCQYNGEYGCEDIDGMVCGNQHLEKVWKEWLASDCEEK